MTDPGALAAQVCSINLVQLDQTLQQHPALRAWINATLEAARVAEERCKWELTKARALAIIAAGGSEDTDAEEDGAKKKGRRRDKTVDVVRAEADTSPRVRMAQEDLLNAEQRRRALQAMDKGMEDRKDMLVQLSANMRAERKEYGTNG